MDRVVRVVGFSTLNLNQIKAWITCQFGFAVGFAVGLRGHHCIWECIFAAQRVCLAVVKDIDVGRKRDVHDHIVGLDEGVFLSPWSV